VTPGRPLLPLVGVGVVAVSWEVATRMGAVSTTVLPRPSDTLSELVALLESAQFWSYLLLTLRAWGLGMVIAATIALPLGIWFGLSDRAYRFVRLPLEAIRPVPPIVILPLALLALGGGLAFQSALIVQGAMWPLLVTVVYGIRTTEAVTLDTARSFRLGSWRTLAFVRLPAAAPLIGSGLRLAAATAFAVTIVSELLGGARGIGTVLMIAESGGNVITVYAVTIVAGLVGLMIATVFGLAERRLLGWQVGTP
jgi:ABC-type nitrate/sulfonate/bicarbonate transport system permease component